MKRSAYSHSPYGQMRDRINEREQDNRPTNKIYTVKHTKKRSGVKYNNYTNQELINEFSRLLNA